MLTIPKSGSLSRRALLGGLLLSALSRQAMAGAWATDIGVHTEPSLAPALRLVAQDYTLRTGIGVAVLAAPASLLLAQIQRNPAEDILALPNTFLDQAAQRKFIAPDTRRDLWRNPLLLAVSAGHDPQAKDAAALLASGPVAVPDATVASSLDGHAVLAALGLATGMILGAANTEDAADLVLTGKAASALVFATDLRATPRLSLGATLPATAAQSCGFALNADPPSKNAHAFWTYLQQSEARSRLHAAGLEVTV